MEVKRRRGQRDITQLEHVYPTAQSYLLLHIQNNEIKRKYMKQDLYNTARVTALEYSFSTKMDLPFKAVLYSLVTEDPR